MTICFTDNRALAKFCQKCIFQTDRYFAIPKLGSVTDIVIKPSINQAEIGRFCDMSVSDIENLLRENKVKFNWVSQY